MSPGDASAAIHYVFPHHYEVKLLASYSLLHPAEKLYQFPAELEEGDRNGIHLRVMPAGSAAWIGFFALGFESGQVASGIFSCPDPDWVCVVAGGYAYAVDSANPARWMQIEQRPVTEVRAVPELKLLLFTGFTTITALGESQRLWTTERLSWEGLSVKDIQGATLHGMGWDVITDKEVPFEVDLLTGKSKGGARPPKNLTTDQHG
jgi:hypothetical protein